MELDFTCAIYDPHVVSLPHFIVNGISLPVVYVAGPQEFSWLYSLYYNESQVDNAANTRLHLLPVLSDNGPEIIKFCKENNLLQFFCI